MEGEILCQERILCRLGRQSWAHLVGEGSLLHDRLALGVVGSRNWGNGEMNGTNGNMVNHSKVSPKRSGPG